MAGMPEVDPVGMTSLPLLLPPRGALLPPAIFVGPPVLDGGFDFPPLLLEDVDGRVALEDELVFPGVAGLGVGLGIRDIVTSVPISNPEFQIWDLKLQFLLLLIDRLKPRAIGSNLRLPLGFALRRSRRCSASAAASAG